MTRKIIISKDILEDLYINKKLSTHQIARQFNCDPGVIQRRLRECNLKLRSPKKKIVISRNELLNLYSHKKFSTQKIARILGISSCAVYYKLKDMGIETRHKKLVKVSRRELKKLYLNDQLSCSEIANRLDCGEAAVFQKLRKFKIKTRSLSEAGITYSKKEFLGDNKLKAYMIGFRLGDLNVKTKTGETILVKSNTTKREQLDLIKDIYGKYGHFKASQGKSDYCIWCNLGKSFSFLLPKEDKIEDWILNEDIYFLSFLAGYTDAEGNFGVYSKQARFRIGSYDKNILRQIANKLNLFEINAKFNLEGKAVVGQRNKDFYRVSINDKNSLLKFINLIKADIRHHKRYKDMILCENNILERNKKYMRRE
jgi:predicted DNA-binding protein YlxM (UPF0122 family)